MGGVYYSSVNKASKASGVTDFKINYAVDAGKPEVGGKSIRAATKDEIKLERAL